MTTKQKRVRGQWIFTALLLHDSCCTSQLVYIEVELDPRMNMQTMQNQSLFIRRSLAEQQEPWDSRHLL